MFMDIWKEKGRLGLPSFFNPTFIDFIYLFIYLFIFSTVFLEEELLCHKEVFFFLISVFVLQKAYPTSTQWSNKIGVLHK